MRELEFKRKIVKKTSPFIVAFAGVDESQWRFVAQFAIFIKSSATAIWTDTFKNIQDLNA
jgi:hypothetical protein